MDPRERRAAERRLALLEFLLAALRRRGEVLDVVWATADRHQAAEHLRQLLGDGADPRVVLDMEVGRMTVEARDEIAANVAQLRRVLGRE